MAKTLEAHDKLIREIFEGSYQFEIPDYQRPYARQPSRPQSCSMICTRRCWMRVSPVQPANTSSAVSF